MTSLFPALERIRADVRAMRAYGVQSADGCIKLDAMENPHTLPPALQQALGERLGRLPVNRYPHAAQVERLRAALLGHAKPPADWALMLGNGSDELIGLLALACAQPGACVMAPAPSFVFYEMTAQQQRLRFCAVPLAADFQLDEAAMLAAIECEKPALLYLAHPNNPTGTLWDAAAMQRIIAAQGAQGGIAVIDEAYQPFAARTWLDEVQPARDAHVLVMRTLSKFGLAGVRLGYLVGDARLIAEIDKVRPPYNVGTLNLECALFALEHADEFARQAADIRAQRQRLMNELAALPGCTVWPSEGNMVLLRVAGTAEGAQRVFDGMKARGVLVKHVSAMHPQLAGCLRLTVGSAEENTQMLAALRAALSTP